MSPEDKAFVEGVLAALMTCGLIKLICFVVERL